MDLYFFQGLAWSTAVQPPATSRKRAASSIARCPPIPTMLTRSSDWRTADMAAGVLSLVADPMAAFTSAEAKLTKVLSSVPDHARAHMSLGFSIYSLSGPLQRASPYVNMRLQLDRNLAHAHSTIGFGKSLIGRAEETEAYKHCRGPAPQSARHVGLYLDDSRGRGEVSTSAVTTKRSVRTLSAVDRGQSKLSDTVFPVGCHPRAHWSTGRGALRRVKARASRSTRASPSHARVPRGRR